MVQGSCTSGEICFAVILTLAPHCTRICAGQLCPGTTRCSRQPVGDTTDTFCMPGCLPANGSADCPAGLACVPSTPNRDEAGTCLPTCTSSGACNAPGAGTAFRCSSGFCACTRDSDCGSSGSSRCDVDSGACYTACGSACSEYAGCCVDTGAVSYCDPGNVPTIDAGPADDFVSGAHTPWPQVPFNGGPVLAQPQVITILYPDYDHIAGVEQYADWIVTSSWLEAVGADYGVSTGTNRNVLLATSAPHSVRDTGISAPELDGGLSPFQKSVDALLQAGTLPAPTPNTVYMFYFPSSTTITGDGVTSCVQFAAYHNSFVSAALAGNPTIPYAVMPECRTDIDSLESLEVGASHELIESATDPNMATLAWDFTSPAAPWSYPGGEVADMCEFGVPTYFDPSGTFAAQRIWSNSAARDGGTPCIPLPTSGVPFLGLSPLYPPDGGQTFAIEPGQTLTVEMQAWSNQPAQTWYAGLGEVMGSGPSPLVSPTFPSLPEATNGATVSFTVTMPADAGSGDSDMLLVRPHSAQTYDFEPWPIVIYVP